MVYYIMNEFNCFYNSNFFELYKKWCNRDRRCKKLQLTDLLVSPVHHIMKIPLVVRDIQSRTENETEKNVISKVLEMKEKSLSK